MDRSPWSVDSADALPSWDRAAVAYNASLPNGPRALAAIYEPVVDELLADVANKSVLDAGCGDGRYARQLAARGARAVVLDVSEPPLGAIVRTWMIVAPPRAPAGATSVLMSCRRIVLSHRRSKTMVGVVGR